MKYILLVLILIGSGGILYNFTPAPLTKEEIKNSRIKYYKSRELCYDGVVYITGIHQLSVKFNKDSNVVTCEER